MHEQANILDSLQSSILLDIGGIEHDYQAFIMLNIMSQDRTSGNRWAGLMPPSYFREDAKVHLHMNLAACLPEQALVESSIGP